MLAKRSTRILPVDPAELVAYISDAEKSAWLHVENFAVAECADDLDIAVQEIQAVQRLNTRAKNDKTYHLITSFGATERPSPAQRIDVQRHLSDSLGFGRHQRIVALHTNTAHWHLHILINRVCRFTQRCLSPFRDFFTLSQACRELELRHGFQRDAGLHHIEGDTIMRTDVFDRRSALVIRGREGSLPSNPNRLGHSAEPADGASISRTWRGFQKIRLGQSHYLDRGDRLTAGKGIDDRALAHLLVRATEKFGRDLNIEGQEVMVQRARRVAVEIGLNATIHQPPAVVRPLSTEWPSPALSDNDPLSPAVPHRAAPAKVHQAPEPSSKLPVLEPASATWKPILERPTLTAPSQLFYLQYQRPPRAVDELGDYPSTLRVRDYERVMASGERSAKVVLKHHINDADQLRVITPAALPAWARETAFNDVKQIEGLQNQATTIRQTRSKIADQNAARIDRFALRIAHSAGRDRHQQNPFDRERQADLHQAFQTGRQLQVLRHELSPAPQNPAQVLEKTRPLSVDGVEQHRAGAPSVRLTPAQEGQVQQVIARHVAEGSGKFYPAKETGQYRGPLVATIDHLGIQRVGQHTFIVHDLNQLPSQAVVGDPLKIDYQRDRITLQHDHPSIPARQREQAVER